MEQPEDSSLFRYNIIRFDEEKKVLYVEFDDGGRTCIPLLLPFPRTLEEIDDIIRAFATPKELIDAARAPGSNLAFIKDYVGSWRETKRIELSKHIQPTLNG